MRRLLLPGLLVLALGACSQPGKRGDSPETKAAEARVDFSNYPAARLDASKALSRIAFGSCSDPKTPQPLWSTIVKSEPQLFIALGDNTYASRPEDKPIWKMYRNQLEVPVYREFRASVPMLATWDDHDFGQNDGGVDNPEKETAKKDFLEVFPNDAALIPADRGGVYHSVTVGPPGQRVQFILLDTRWFRSPLEKNQTPKHPLDIYQPTRDKEKTVLGEEQWAWLAEELDKPADLRFLVSSIQVIAEDHGFEKWANFPHERKRLFDLIRRKKARNLVILSGDRHQGEVSLLKLDPNLALLDVTGSGINRTATLESEPNRHRQGDRIGVVNFGLAEIDWKKRSVKIDLIGLDGNTLSTVSRKF